MTTLLVLTSWLCLGSLQSSALQVVRHVAMVSYRSWPRVVSGGELSRKKGKDQNVVETLRAKERKSERPAPIQNFSQTYTHHTVYPIYDQRRQSDRNSSLLSHKLLHCTKPRNEVAFPRPRYLLPLNTWISPRRNAHYREYLSLSALGRDQARSYGIVECGTWVRGKARSMHGARRVCI